MRIYCYHEPLPGFPDQTPLIEIWFESWKRQGFEPYVLREENAAGHRWFADLDGWDHLALSVNPWPYTRACYRRWMAYSQILEADVRFCDYDVINVGLPVKEVPVPRESGLWLGDRSKVPCFGVASKASIENTIRMFRNAAVLRQAGTFCVQDDISDMNLIRDFGDVVSRDLVSLYGDGRRRPLVHFAHACFRDADRISGIQQWWAEKQKEVACH